MWVVLAVVAGLILVSLCFRTLRRVWVFGLVGSKYVAQWVANVLGLRWVWAKLRGKTYRPYSRARALRLFFEDLGPTFIKFGQIIASSPGLFPRAWVEEFQKCLDRVRPFAFHRVKEIIDEELGDKTGQLVDIEPKQLASASIAQVHTARLADGTDVVIKVQRPGIEKRVEADMRVLRFVAVVAEKLVRDAELANPVGVVEDFAETLREEIDFRKEAANLDEFNRIMLQHGHKDIRAPRPYHELTTRRVLVMERFHGIRVDDVATIRERNVDAEKNLVKGMVAWFQCVIFHGFFHGDVHAGNLMLLDNGDIGFLDFGIVGRFNDRQRYLVTDYIVAFASGDFRKLAETIVEMGGVKNDLEMEAFASDLKTAYSPLLHKSMGQIDYAELMPEIHRVSSKHRMRMPKEFVLITKQMLYFDRYAKALAPDLNVFTDPRLIMSMMMDIQKARAENPQKTPQQASA